MHEALTSVMRARSNRISAMLSDLPDVQYTLLRWLGCILVACFGLADFTDNPSLRARLLSSVLFGSLAGCLNVLDCILMDLRNVNDGNWNIDPARQALHRLSDEIRGSLGGRLAQGLQRRSEIDE